MENPIALEFRIPFIHNRDCQSRKPGYNLKEHDSSILLVVPGAEARSIHLHFKI